MSLVVADSDEHLMQRYSQGDAAALQTLFVRHARRLQAFFLCLLPQPEQAAELCEKTWLRVHRTRRSYEDNQPFVPWLYSHAVQVRRDLARQSVVQASQPGAARPVTDSASLLRALRDLPDSYREVVVLQRLMNLNLAAIAQVLGATEQAVQQRAQQGYEQLADSADAGQEASPATGDSTSRSARGEALFDPKLLDGIVEATPLEHSARALLPIVARDLTPSRTPWPLFAAFVLLVSIVALMFLRMTR